MRKCVFIILIMTWGSCLGETATELIDPTVLLMNVPVKKAKAAEPSIASKQAAGGQDNADKATSPVLAKAQTKSAINFPAWPVGTNAEEKGPAWQLWRERISGIGGQENSTGKSELAKSVNQLRSIEISRPRGADYKVEPIILKTSGPPQTSEPNTASAAADANIGDTTERLVRLLVEKPAAVEDSFNTAELLYIKGYLKEAAIFYRQSLNKQGLPLEERAWILYQVGNCLRNSDAAGALASYRQLITEYPQSRWSDAAKAQERVLDWLQREKIKELLN